MSRRIMCKSLMPAHEFVREIRESEHAAGGGGHEGMFKGPLANLNSLNSLHSGSNQVTVGI